MLNKTSDIRPRLKFETQIEKKILSLVDKYIHPSMTKKDFIKLIENYGIKEQGETEAPVKPDVDTPVKPEKPTPATPYKPKHKPAPKAGEKESPVITPVKPDVDTPRKPTPATPYKPKHKPAPKAEEEVPTWLSFDSIGIKFLGK